MIHSPFQYTRLAEELVAALGEKRFGVALLANEDGTLTFLQHNISSGDVEDFLKTAIKNWRALNK